jgi:hypothetical protein
VLSMVDYSNVIDFAAPHFIRLIWGARDRRCELKAGSFVGVLETCRQAACQSAGRAVPRGRVVFGAGEDGVR